MSTDISEQTRVYALLLTAAREGDMLTYGDVAKAAGFGMKTQADGVRAGNLLDCISRVETEHDRPMLGAIVVRKAGGIGGGFLTLATQLGRLPTNATDGEKAAFVKSEQSKVFATWAPG